MPSCWSGHWLYEDLFAGGAAVYVGVTSVSARMELRAGIFRPVLNAAALALCCCRGCCCCCYRSCRSCRSCHTGVLATGDVTLHVGALQEPAQRPADAQRRPRPPPLRAAGPQGHGAGGEGEPPRHPCRRSGDDMANLAVVDSPPFVKTKRSSACLSPHWVFPAALSAPSVFSGLAGSLLSPPPSPITLFLYNLTESRHFITDERKVTFPH